MQELIPILTYSSCYISSKVCTSRDCGLKSLLESGCRFWGCQQAVQVEVVVWGGLGCSGGGGGGEEGAWGGEKTEIPTERALALTTPYLGLLLLHLSIIKAWANLSVLGSGYSLCTQKCLIVLDNMEIPTASTEFKSNCINLATSSTCRKPFHLYII